MLDAARMAAQSDPDLNPQFRRRWSGPPLEHKSPRTTGMVRGPAFEDTRNTKEDRETARLFQWASRLDRLADAELALGHHGLAEHLSRQAAEMREGAR